MKPPPNVVMVAGIQGRIPAGCVEAAQGRDAAAIVEARLADHIARCEYQHVRYELPSGAGLWCIDPPRD